MSEVYKPSQALDEAIETFIRLVEEANFPTPNATEHGALVETFEALRLADGTTHTVATQTLIVLKNYWLSRNARIAPPPIALGTDNADAGETNDATSTDQDLAAAEAADSLPKSLEVQSADQGNPNSGSITEGAEQTESINTEDRPAAAQLTSTAPETLSEEDRAEPLYQEQEPSAALPPELTPDVGHPVPDAVIGLPPGSAPQTRPLEARKVNVHLRNARVGEDYQARLEVKGLKDAKLENDGGTGLVWDAATETISGNLAQAGDFKLIFRGLLDGFLTEVAANLAVIPDPKSLWVSKPSNTEDEYWKLDEAFDKFDGELFCAAASKRGRSHARDGGFRDDDFGLKTLGNGSWHIATVADGAGSAKFSRRGSKIAVDTVLALLPELLESHVSPNLDALLKSYQSGEAGAEGRIRQALYSSLAQTAFSAAKAIESEAKAKLCEPTAYYTTLIIGVCKKTSAGWFFASFSIGDGGAAVFSLPAGTIKTMTLPDGGEFAGQTRFLQCSEFAGGYEDIAKRLFFDIRPDFTAFLLMTDGITDPKFPTDVVFADPAKWVEFWCDDFTKEVEFERGNTELEREFLTWMDFWSPGNHDDRTLAVMVP